MGNKKGFTLVELLAVIVILVIIILITTPIILNTIEDSRCKSFEITVDSLNKEIETYLTKKDLKKLSSCNDLTMKLTDLQIRHKGQIDKNSYACYSEEETCNYIHIKNKYYEYTGCIKNYKNCKSGEGLQPVIIPGENCTGDDCDFVLTSTTNSITVYVVWGNAEKVEYRIKKTSEKKWGSWQTSNIFTNLKYDTEYQVQTRGTNKEGEYVSSKIKKIKTKSINVPQVTIDPTDWAREKQVIITYDDTNLDNPGHYFKSTVGITSENNVYECGTDDEGLKSCSSTSTKTIKKDTWYKVSGTTVTVNYEANGTLIARISDDYNFVDASQTTITEIDRNDPATTLKSSNITNTEINVEATCTDNESPISKVEFYVNGTKVKTYSYTDNAKTKVQVHKYDHLESLKYYSLKAICYDSANNSKQATLSRQTYPQATFSVDNDDWAKSKNVTITWPASYYISGEYAAEYSINGGTTWTTSVNVEETIPISKENVTIIARIKYKGEYISSNAYQVSKIDVTKPTIHNYSPTKTSHSITYYGECDDYGSGVQRGYYYLYDEGDSLIKQESFSYSTPKEGQDIVNKTFTKLKSGTTYKLKFSCFDAVGNYQESDFVTVSTESIDVPTHKVTILEGSKTGYDWAKKRKDVITYPTLASTSLSYSFKCIPKFSDESATVTADIIEAYQSKTKTVDCDGTTSYPVNSTVTITTNKHPVNIIAIVSDENGNENSSSRDLLVTDTTLNDYMKPPSAQSEMIVDVKDSCEQQRLSEIGTYKVFTIDGKRLETLNGGNPWVIDSSNSAYASTNNCSNWALYLDGTTGFRLAKTSGSSLSAPYTNSKPAGFYSELVLKQETGNEGAVINASITEDGVNKGFQVTAGGTWAYTWGGTRTASFANPIYDKKVYWGSRFEVGGAPLVVKGSSTEAEGRTTTNMGYPINYATGVNQNVILIGCRPNSNGVCDTTQTDFYKGYLYAIRFYWTPEFGDDIKMDLTSMERNAYIDRVRYNF